MPLVGAFIVQGFLFLIPLVVCLCVSDATKSSKVEHKMLVVSGVIAAIMFVTFCAAVWVGVLL